jgi:two-component system, NarL family, nitrate/nitrite response regulator NarL
MRDIFVCPNGNLLDNWKKAFPKALITESLTTVPINEPVIFWVHANANDKAWLQIVMAGIEKKFKVSKLVVLANTPNQSDALAVMSKGAAGYCHAYSGPEVLKEVKTVVSHGGLWLGNDLLQTLISATAGLVHNTSSNVENALAMLSKRERQVAIEASKGLSNKEIARVLNITERTVKAHISASLEKLGVKDRLQLALVLNEKEVIEKKDDSQLKLISTKKTSQATSSSSFPKKKLERIA